MINGRLEAFSDGVFAVIITIMVLDLKVPHGPHSKLREATGRDMKGIVSMVLYAAAIPLAFMHQLISDAIYLFVALMWLVPDRQIEKQIVNLQS